MDPVIAIICIVAALAIGIVAGFLFGNKNGFKKGYQNRLEIGEKAIGSAEKEAERIVSEATKKGEAKYKEMIVEAKEDILKAKPKPKEKTKNAARKFFVLKTKLSRKKKLWKERSKISNVRTSS